MSIIKLKKNLLISNGLFPRSLHAQHSTLKWISIPTQGFSNWCHTLCLCPFLFIKRAITASWLGDAVDTPDSSQCERRIYLRVGTRYVPWLPQRCWEPWIRTPSSFEPNLQSGSESNSSCNAPEKSCRCACRHCHSERGSEADDHCHLDHERLRVAKLHQWTSEMSKLAIQLT